MSSLAVQRREAHTVPTMAQPIARARHVPSRGLKSPAGETLRAEDVAQVAGRLAHDFDNQLQVVNGYIELAMSLTQDATLLGYLQIASDAAQSNVELMRELRNIASVDLDTTGHRPGEAREAG